MVIDIDTGFDCIAVNWNGCNIAIGRLLPIESPQEIRKLLKKKKKKLSY